MAQQIVLTISEFSELGKIDAQVQTLYCKQRKVEALKVWRCADCGDRLPKSGLIWKSRLKAFIMRFRFEDCSSGLRCDVCVEFPNDEFF